MAQLGGVYTADKTLDETTIEDLTSSSGAVGSYANAIAGTMAGNPLPAGTAFLLNFHIARRYRGGKPRVYLPIGNTAEIGDDQDWGSVFAASIPGRWAAMIAAIQAAPWAGGVIAEQVSVSFYNLFTNFTGPTGRMRARSTPRPGAALVDPVISVTAGTRFASQRRRNRP